MSIFLGLVTLIFLDIILSIDNAILIATVTKDLKEKNRRIVRIVGSSGAVFLRLIFIIVVMFALESLIGIPIIYIAGGGILVYLGISLTIKSKPSKERDLSSGVLKAIAMIMAGDIMMSFDNAFIIGGIVSGFEFSVWIDVVIIIIALLISLIIIMFFADKLSVLMNKYEWIIFVAGWLLISVGIEMILKDYLWNIIIGSSMSGEDNPIIVEKLTEEGLILVSYLSGGIIMFSKWYLFDHIKIQKKK